MNDLSSTARGRHWHHWASRPYRDRRLDQTFIYMDRWHGGCGVKSISGHHWCMAGNHYSNQFALCANGPGMNGRNGDSKAFVTFKGFRYYKVRVAGRMTSHNIWRTCEMHGFVTPCPGAGGKRFNPLPPMSKMKGFKDVFANGNAFVGLREKASSLCQRRSGPDGRCDARCGDGWQEEAKAAGKPVCDDDNRNKLVPCTSLKDACSDLNVQAKCAHTCNTYWKGSKECKQIHAVRSKYKCARTYSCAADNKFVLPEESALEWSKASRGDESKVGCGSAAQVKVARCTADPKKVSCNCPTAYAMNVLSSTRNDCNKREYQGESDKIVRELQALQDTTAEYLSTCTAIPESPKPYKAKLMQMPPLIMKNGKQTVWETAAIHSRTLTETAEGCQFRFYMELTACKTPPYRRMVLQIPSIGAQFKEIGCGCQEVLVTAKYQARITAMENQMRSTQNVCATYFSEWMLHYQKNYFFGGFNYHSHAIRLAKDIKKQCRSPGDGVPPEKKASNKQKSVDVVMKKNSIAIRKYSAQVQHQASKLLAVQKMAKKCEAGLPQATPVDPNQYKSIVDKFSIEPKDDPAAELKMEATALRTKLDHNEHRRARLVDANAKGKSQLDL